VNMLIFSCPMVAMGPMCAHDRGPSQLFGGFVSLCNTICGVGAGGIGGGGIKLIGRERCILLWSSVGLWILCWLGLLW